MPSTGSKGFQNASVKSVFQMRKRIPFFHVVAGVFYLQIPAPLPAPHHRLGSRTLRLAVITSRCHPPADQQTWTSCAAGDRPRVNPGAVRMSLVNTNGLLAFVFFFFSLSLCAKYLSLILTCEIKQLTTC